MYNSQYYTCEQIDERLLQGYLDDYNTQTGQSLTKAQFLTKLGSIFSKEGVIDNTATQIGYYECDTAAGTAAKTLTVANYALFAGGSMKVKFANKNTANNATLNINSQGAKALYYQGERASATNSWDAEEVVEIYYDGTSYYANNVKGGSGSGVYDVSKEHTTSGPNSDGKFTLEYILNPSNVNELIPVNKRYPGMTIQFVSTSDNKYVQYRLMHPLDNVSTAAADFVNTANWQGVDDVPTAGSDNLVKSGGVAEIYGEYIENPEFVEVHVDSDDKILYGVKPNGDFHFGAGVPSQIQEELSTKVDKVSGKQLSTEDYTSAEKSKLSALPTNTELTSALRDKVDKVEGKSLIDAEFAALQNVIENPEWIGVKTDSEDKILEGINNEGTKVIELPLEIHGDLRVNGDVDIRGKRLEDKIGNEISDAIEENFANKSTLDKFSEENNLLKWNGEPVKTDVTELEEQVESNTEDILTLYGIVSSADVPPENAIKFVPTHTLYLGQNILDITSVTYDSNYWTIENGLPKYLGGEGGGETKPFTFNALLSEGSRFLASLSVYVSDSAYESLFYLQIGNGAKVDPYNATANTIGGLISDGGQFKIVPYRTKAFDVTAIALQQCLASEEAQGYSETKNITVNNVDCGNSAATLIEGKWNVAIGPIGSCMPVNVSGTRTIAIGESALRAWENGWQNVAIGTFALCRLKDGNRNIVIGADAAWYIQKGDDNVAVGKGALGEIRGDSSDNVAVGCTALSLNTTEGATQNVAVGKLALSGGDSNVPKQNCVAVGYRAGHKNSTRCIAVGDSAGYHMKGSDNVAVGYLAMNNINIDGQYNICIGSGAKLTSSTTPATINNAIAIGYNVMATKSNQVIIGNSSNDEFVLGNKKLIFNQDGTVTWESI